VPFTRRRRLRAPAGALKHDRYLRLYEELLAPVRSRPVVLLELGVAAGGSLRMWRDFLPRATIVGIDAEPPAEPPAGVHVYGGRQEDTELLDRVAAGHAPSGFDVVVDDCSHLADATRTSFWHLFDRHLKVGGLYVIEDWGVGYWDTWPDGARYAGPPHDAGLVGFVKELVDEVGVQDAAVPNVDTFATGGTRAAFPSKFERLIVTPGQVVAVKAAAPGRADGPLRAIAG
jgi:hypothetical protein